MTVRLTWKSFIQSFIIYNIWVKTKNKPKFHCCILFLSSLFFNTTLAAVSILQKESETFWGEILVLISKESLSDSVCVKKNIEHLNGSLLCKPCIIYIYLFYTMVLLFDIIQTNLSKNLASNNVGFFFLVVLLINTH